MFWAILFCMSYFVPYLICLILYPISYVLFCTLSHPSLLFRLKSRKLLRLYKGNLRVNLNNTLLIFRLRLLFKKTFKSCTWIGLKWFYIFLYSCLVTNMQWLLPIYISVVLSHLEQFLTQENVKMCNHTLNCSIRN